MDTVLLATKVRIPPQPQRVVRRDRVLDVLERAIPRYKLIQLSAPAGYGKTMLLAQWTHATRFPIAWLSLGEENNDVDRFFRYLLAAWEGCSRTSGRAAWGCSLARCCLTSRQFSWRSSTRPTICPATFSCPS